MLITSDICQMANWRYLSFCAGLSVSKILSKYYSITFTVEIKICWAIQQLSIGCQHFWQGVLLTARQTKGKLERERFRLPPLLPSFSSALHTRTHSFDVAHIGRMGHFFSRNLGGHFFSLSKNTFFLQKLSSLPNFSIHASWYCCYANAGPTFAFAWPIFLADSTWSIHIWMPVLCIKIREYLHPNYHAKALLENTSWSSLKQSPVGEHIWFDIVGTLWSLHCNKCWGE